MFSVRLALLSTLHVKMKLLVLSVLLGLACSREVPKDKKQDDQDCQVFLDDNRDWPQYPPIITDSNGQFILPAGTYQADDRVIGLSAGEQWELSCTGEGFTDVGALDFYTAECLSNGRFSVNGDTYDFVDLGCQRQPDDTTLDTGVACGPITDQARTVELGFEVRAGDTYAESVVTCFEEVTARALYAYAVLYKENVARDTSNNAPSFRADAYYDFDVDEAYTRDQQLITLSRLLGSTDLAEHYIQDYNTNLYFQRGHLAPNADQIYYALQDSTYYFVNVAPQWGVFNGGHWVDIENGLRDYVKDQGRDLGVYTGTNGVMTLKNNDEVETEIYLYPDFDGLTRDKLPVPKFFWKLVHDEADNTAVGLVGVNNPWLTDEEIDASYRVCPNSAPQLEGHPLLARVTNPDDIKEGVVYACSYDEIREAFEEVPFLAGNPGILI